MCTVQLPGQVALLSTALRESGVGDKSTGKLIPVSIIVLN